MAEQTVRDMVRKLKVLLSPFFFIVRNTLVAEAVGCKLMLDHVKTVEMYIDSLVQYFLISGWNNNYN